MFAIRSTNYETTHYSSLLAAKYSPQHIVMQKPSNYVLRDERPCFTPKQNNYSIEQNLHWNANSRSASQKTPNILRTRRYITTFKRTFHWSLSWFRWIQSTPYLKFILILSFHLCLRQPLPRDAFSSDFSITIVYAIIFSMRATRSNPSHPPCFCHPNKVWWRVTNYDPPQHLLSPFSCYFFLPRYKYSCQYPVPNITNCSFKSWMSINSSRKVLYHRFSYIHIPIYSYNAAAFP